MNYISISVIALLTGKLVQYCVRFQVFTAVNMKNIVFLMLCRVALVGTYVSEKLSASIISVIRICVRNNFISN
jgi:hypothetical protein